MANLTVPLLADSAGSKFGALVNSADGTPKYWRARATAGDYGGAEVLLYDVAGNPIHSAAATLGDAVANPTVGGLASFGLMYQQALSQWARIPAARLVDGVSGPFLGTSPEILNGSGNYDRLRGIPAADAQAAAGYLGVGGLTFNETNHDRLRGNSPSVTLFASAARTANATSGVLTNYNGRGVACVLNVTAKAGTTTLNVRVLDAQNSGQEMGTIQFAAAIGGSYVAQFYPGLLNADFSQGGGRSMAVPRAFQLGVVHSDASSITYSLTYQIIL